MKDTGKLAIVDESQPAHELFRQAFHFDESLRFKATEALLDEYAREPNNVYTVFAITAHMLWTGGEAPIDDPTILYDFVIGSYFSLLTIDLARELEERWVQDPESATRFRMAANLGGFSALQRRWLAVLHGDEAALAAIDDEHREWRLIHRAFHAFTVGIPFFEEPKNFAEGLFAILDATPHCQEVPVRTCTNSPRFFFTQLSFVLTAIDFFIKAGEIETARMILGFRFDPDVRESWDHWDLGRAPWLHREQNLHAIAELYQNGDPSDDPLHFQLKRKQWGTNTTTCQNCHQTQSKTWTSEEFNTVQLPPEEVATVGVWPKFSTTWYSALLRP
jgi:hypothetical protein